MKPNCLLEKLTAHGGYVRGSMGCTLWSVFFGMALFLIVPQGIHADNKYWADKKAYFRIDPDNPATIRTHFVTYDQSGEDDRLVRLNIYMTCGGIERQIFSLGEVDSDNRYGNKDKWRFINLTGKRNQTWKEGGGDVYYTSWEFYLKECYWGELTFRFEGRFAYEPNNSNGVNFNYTSTTVVDVGKWRFTDKSYISSREWTSPTTLKVSMKDLPKIENCNSSVWDSWGGGRTEHTGGSLSVTVTGANAAAGLSYWVWSDVTYGTNKANKKLTYNASPVASFSNLKATFRQYDKKNCLTWEVANKSNYTNEKAAIFRREKNVNSWGSWSRIATQDISTTYTDGNIKPKKTYEYAVSYYRNVTTWAVPEKPADKDARCIITTTPKFDIVLETQQGLEKILLTWTYETNAMLNGCKFWVYRGTKKIGEVNYTSEGGSRFEDRGDASDESVGDPISGSFDYKVILKGESSWLASDFSSEIVQGIAINAAYITKMTASKGVFANRVRIDWEVQNYIKEGAAEPARTQYAISRRSLETENSNFTELYRTSSNEDFLYWVDEQALPGIYYEYKIDVQSVATDKQGSKVNTNKKDVGFCQSSGNVSGRIVYGSGTAVQNVSVRMKRNSENNDMTNFRALNFNGMGGAARWSLTAKEAAKFFNTNDFSMQMWLRPESMAGIVDTHQLLKVNGAFSVTLHPDESNDCFKAYVVVGSSRYEVAKSVLPNVYNHLTIARSGNYMIGTLVQYPSTDNPVIEEDTAILNTSSLYTVQTENYFSLGHGYTGFVDEFRFWTKALTLDEIKNNYDRLLAGNETGLEAYWHFDEGLTSLFFDCSRKGSVQNGHHGTLTPGVQSSDLIPSDAQLSFKATTDVNGNYMISGVPYGGEGTSYSVTPTMGVHQFEPSQHLRYVGPNSLVHNGTDFADISSFTVKGKVLYSGGEYPVEGVQVAIDGQTVTKDGEIVQTDEEGKFEVDVPIGDHFITVSKSGHTFANGGRYPSNVNEKVNFQNDILSPPLTFTDETKTCLIGRVVAGAIEAEKKTGMGLSKTHIGKAFIELQPLDDRYRLNNDSTQNRFIHNDTVKYFNNTAYIVKESCKILIETDSVTGEFAALLPPLEYKVLSVSTRSVGSDNFSNDLIQFKLDPLTTEIVSDTIYDETGAIDLIKSLKYHECIDFVYYKTPLLYVTDMAFERTATPDAFGDSVYYYDDGTLKDTIPLFTGNSGSLSYLLGHPTFTQSTRYNFKIRGVEQYINSDVTPEVVVDVPTAGATITSTNNLASHSVNVSDNALSSSNSTFVLNDKGEAVYRFMGGFPNMLGDHTVTCEFDLNHNGRNAKWRLGKNDNKGIVLGTVPMSGNDFVTGGPSLVDFVLHDPPGSNSYAYLEKGSTISKEVSVANLKSGEEHLGLYCSFGAAIITGVGVMMESEIINDLEAGVDISYEVSDRKTHNYTVENVERIETGSSVEVGGSSDFVGGGGDIFIGSNTNLLFSTSKQLGLFKEGSVENDEPIPGSAYSIANKEVVTMGLTFSTRFQYTQVHIEERLIPEFKKLRKSLLVKVDDYADSALYQKEDKSVYITTKDINDACFDKDTLLESGTDYMWLPPSNKEICSDQVAEYGTSIINWRKVLGRNEEDKVNAFKYTSKKTSTYKPSDLDGEKISFDYGYLGNYSIDAGSSLESSTKRHHIHERETTDNYLIQSYISTHVGGKVGGVGLQASVELKNGGGKSDETRKSDENYTQFGYVLADPDKHNYLSVDVYLPGSDKVDGDSIFLAAAQNGHSYMFRLRGGQTSCPYEGPTATKYYDPGAPLDEGAQQLNQPAIQISSSSKLTDLPSGREASFDVILGNNNTEYPQTYVLNYLEESNPDGLIVTLDGASLAYGRSFDIGAGATIRKTLKIKQSKVDVLNYDDIVLRFGSDCDANIYETVNLNVSFVPSSSDLTFEIPNRTLNLNTGNELNYIISDFDRSFTNFAGIQVKYKKEGATTWTLVKEYVNDGTLIEKNDENVFISDVVNNGKISDSFRLSVEGKYVFAAVSIAKQGLQSDEVTFWSDEISVVCDMSRPESMGAPSPSNGILTNEDEVSVTFNENILKSAITENFLSVTGELNGFDLKHNVGLLLTGPTASTSARIGLSGSSFAIESWFKRTPGEAGTLIAHGNDFTLGFTADDKVTVTCGRDTFVSESALPSPNWQYIAFSYDNDLKSITVNALYESSTVVLMNNKAVGERYAGNNRLYVGADANGNNHFNGAMHELTLWSKTRTMADLSDKDYAKSGRETGLIGYWRMDEGRGTTVTDKARSRHIALSANNWYLNNTNYAAVFNGSNYVELPAGEIYVSKDEDFAIELWFKGTAQNAATLFSSGDGVEDDDLDGKLSIGFNSEGKLGLRAGGTEVVLSETSCLDDNWHQLLLNVARGGYASAYVDGSLVKHFSAGNIGALFYGNYLLGARRYVKESVQYIDSYFTGKIDDVRLWEATMTAELFELYRYNRLQGNEPGLSLYYPFERSYTDSYMQKVTEASLQGTALATGTVAFDRVDVPPLQESRTTTSVDHSFTVSDNKIVINITEPAYRIENCMLEFTLKRATDVNGNEMNPIMWTAYVDKNRLLWSKQEVELVNEQLTENSFTVQISNTGGKEENWVVSNIPLWLNLNKSQGTLKQLSQETLTFTVDESTPIGTYEAVLYLTGNNNIQEPLYVTITVTGEKPEWNVNPADFEGSMNLVAQLNIENYPSQDVNDLVAAFIDDVCVGVASPIYISKFDGCFVMMDIYGNGNNTGKDVLFKVWDASTGRVYPTVVVKDYTGTEQTIHFSDGTIKGSPAEPFGLNAEDILEQNIALKKGWNWVSLNVNRNFGGADEQMYSDLIFDKVKGAVSMIKDQTLFVNCDNGVWDQDGSLYQTELTPAQMYMVNMTADATLPIVGSMVDPETTDVTVSPLWNWIGYTPQDPFNVEYAFADLAPSEGDIVKGQSQFAYYTDNAWVGSLKYLQPGHGYMYKSMNESNVTFHYPSVYAGGSGIRSMERGNAATNRELYWSCNYGMYPNNMTMIAQVIDANGNVLMNGDVALFDGETCRGVHAINNNGKVYLTVCGDADTELSFKVYNRDNAEVYDVARTITYKNNAMYGSSSSPYIIELNPTGVKVARSSVSIYPRIANEAINITASDAIRKITVSTVAGVMQSIEGDGTCEKTIFTGQLAKGIYLITVSTESETVTERIIKQ